MRIGPDDGMIVTSSLVLMPIGNVEFFVVRYDLIDSVALLLFAGTCFFIFSQCFILAIYGKESEL